MYPKSWLLLGALLAACSSPSPAFVDAAGAADAEVAPDAPVCPVCDVHATCEDLTCTCAAGYAGDGLTCVDVDECLEAGTCSADATCTNTDGGHTCDCDAPLVGDGVSCGPAWSVIATLAGLTLNVDGYGILAVGVGQRIYFAPLAADPGHQDFRYIDLSATPASLSAPLALPSADFMASGLGGSLVAGGGGIYLFGDTGERFDLVNETWSAVPAYADDLRRGEAAAVYDATTQHVMLVGGRDTDNNLLDTATTIDGAGAIGAEPGAMPYAFSNAGAWQAPSGVIFVFGGRNTSSILSHLVEHLAGTDVWNQLADAPTAIDTPVGMGHFGARIWATNGAVLELYNPSTTTWDVSIAMPAGVVAAVTAGDATYALAQVGADVDVYRLVAVE